MLMFPPPEWICIWLAVVVPSFTPDWALELLYPVGTTPPLFPPPIVIFPPPESLSPVRPLAELITLSSPSTTGPPALLSLFDQKVTSPLLVWKFRLAIVST